MPFRLQCFRGESEIPPFTTPPSGIFGILPGTFNFTCLVTLVLTLVVRRRVKTGVVGRSADGEGLRVGSALPANVALRALVLALAATLSAVPLTAGALWCGVQAGLIPPVWSKLGMLVFFVVYFVVLALAITPIVVRRALRD